MNLDKLKPSWDQFKFINGMEDIKESEILASIEPKDQGTNVVFSKRLLQNTFVFSFLILALSGGCTI
jgi:hypothetical protein